MEMKYLIFKEGPQLLACAVVGSLCDFFLTFGFCFLLLFVFFCYLFVSVDLLKSANMICACSCKLSDRVYKIK